MLYGRVAMGLRLSLLLLVAAVGLRALFFRGPEHPALDDYGRVPDFTLRDQRNVSVGPADFAGRPWVANFIFTRCPTSCPVLTAKFANLQRAVADLPGVRFVSFSVDPEHDTPQVLSEYAARYDADPARWWFLTGPLDEVERTVVQGFKIHIGEPQADPRDPTIFDIMHGEHFVLVDAQGHIRGYFHADPEGLTALESALRELPGSGR